MRNPGLQRVDIEPIATWGMGPKEATHAINLAFKDYYDLLGQIVNKESEFYRLQPDEKASIIKRRLSDEQYTYDIEYDPRLHPQDKVRDHLFRILISKKEAKENIQIVMIKEAGERGPSGVWGLRMRFIEKDKGETHEKYEILWHRDTDFTKISQKDSQTLDHVLQKFFVLLTKTYASRVQQSTADAASKAKDALQRLMNF